MGVYPAITYLDVNTGRPIPEASLPHTGAWYEEYYDYAVRRYRLVTAEVFAEVRETCFCCTCGDREGSDPYCRNHGWMGERSCEEHGQIGTARTEGGGPVATVQQYRQNRSMA